MAEVSRRHWQCSTCNLSIDVNVPVCPQCQAKRPSTSSNFPEPGQPLSQIPSVMSRTEHPEHRAEGTEQRIEVLPVQCHECGTSLQIVGKFCPECGARLSTHNTQTAPMNTAKMSTRISECHFCMCPLQISETGEKQCLHCRRPQPNPQGPQCIHGCGARLIFPGAKICARCSKPQHTTIRPPDSVSSPGSLPIRPEYGTRHGYGQGYGYGYPNNPVLGMVFGHQNVQPFGPQQFGPQASIHTAVPIRQPPPPLPGLPHPNSGHAQNIEDGMSGPSKTVTSPSTAGAGGSFPSNLNESPQTGHPHGAWFIELKGSSEENKSSGSENELKTPVQETAQDSHPKETKTHPLQSDDSKDGTNSRKRKKSNESDDAGKSKQNKLEKNDSKNADSTKPQGDNDQAPNSNNPDKANSAPVTVTGTTNTTSTATTSSGAGTTGPPNQESQVSYSIFL